MRSKRIRDSPADSSAMTLRLTSSKQRLRDHGFSLSLSLFIFIFISLSLPLSLTLLIVRQCWSQQSLGDVSDRQSASGTIIAAQPRQLKSLSIPAAIQRRTFRVAVAAFDVMVTGGAGEVPANPIRVYVRAALPRGTMERRRRFPEGEYPEREEECEPLLYSRRWSRCNPPPPIGRQ